MRCLVIFTSINFHQTEAVGVVNLLKKIKSYHAGFQAAVLSVVTGDGNKIINALWQNMNGNDNSEHNTLLETGISAFYDKLRDGMIVPDE